MTVRSIEPAATSAPAKAPSLGTLLSYKGWAMVGISFVCVLFAFSAPVVTMPLIYGEVMKEFGWSHTQATMIYTYKYAASSLVAMFLVAPFIERFGLRATMAVSCLATSVGMLSFLFIHSLWTYDLAGLLFGLGGTTILIPVKVLVSRWFSRNQGVAIGATAIAISVGGLIFPLLANLMIHAFGWRVAFASLSIGIWGVALPLYLWKANDHPTEQDILPEAVGVSRNAAIAAKVAAADYDFNWTSLLSTHTFWCIAVGLFVVGAMDSGMLQHSVLYLKSAGFSSNIAAASLAGTFALGIVAKLLAGKVYDSFSVRGIQLWYVLLAISIGMIFWVQSLAMLTVYTIVRGIAHGGLITEVPVLAKHCYGVKAMNKTLPVFTGIYGLGAAIGPLVLSVMYDRYHSYSYGFGVFLVSCLLAAILLSWVKPMYRNRLRAALAGA